MKKKELDFNNLSNIDLDCIKSIALKMYVDNHVHPSKTDVYTAQCYVSAVVQFINANGFKIEQKEENNGK